MDEQRPDPNVAASGGLRRRFGVRIVAVSAAGLIALGVAGLAIATAQTPPASPSPGETSPDRVFGGRLGGQGGFGHHGLGRGVLHGEFTTAAPAGGYQTLAVQNGEVASVSASSITIRSDDGFSRTYRVDDNTLVNAGNDGIADVRDGDTVRITAVVSGQTARAVDIVDVTRVRESRGRWFPSRPRASAGPSGRP